MRFTMNCALAWFFISGCLLFQMCRERRSHRFHDFAYSQIFMRNIPKNLRQRDPCGPARLHWVDRSSKWVSDSLPRGFFAFRGFSPSTPHLPPSGDSGWIVSTDPAISFPNSLIREVPSKLSGEKWLPHLRSFPRARKLWPAFILRT